MSVIDNLIYDRTQDDVLRVFELKHKILTQGLSALTAAEKTEYLAGMKGAYNATDLNRVGEAVAYIAADMLLYATLTDTYRTLVGANDILNFYDTTLTSCTVVGTPSDYTLTATANGSVVISYPISNSRAGETYYLSGLIERMGEHVNNIAIQLQRTLNGTTGYPQQASYVNNVADLSNVAITIPSGATNIALRIVVATSQDSSSGETARVRDFRLCTRPDLYRGGVAPNPLVEMPYDPSSIVVTAKQDWTMADVPTQAQAAAFLADLSVLRAVLVLPAGTPAVPVTLDNLTYITANNIERLLSIIETTLLATYTEVKDNIDKTAHSFAFAGEAICGIY